MFRRFFEHARLGAREARFVRVFLLLSAGLNLLDWVLTLWFVVPRLETSPFFALHYTVYFGVDRIGPPWKLLGAPLLGLVLLAANAALCARLLSKNDRLAASFLAMLTIVLEALLFINALLIVLVNL